MKIRKWSVWLVVLCCCLSCKEYLDIKPDRALATPSSLKDLQAILDSETRLNTNYPAAGDIAADYFYYSEKDFNARSEEVRDTYRWKAQAANDMDWQYTYTRIFDTNVVLESVADADLGSLTETDRERVAATAHFFRGWSFLQLAQLFAPPYQVEMATQQQGLPIRLTAAITAPTARATLEETYAQIRADLLAAAQGLPTTTPVATRPCKATAWAALARSCLIMGRYDEALQYAEQALQLNSQLLDFNTLDAEASKPIEMLNVEVLLHTQLTSARSAFSNAIRKVKPEWFDMYGENDLRKTVFFDVNKDGTYKFKGDYGTSKTATLPFCGLAVDEVFLVKAECLAHLGKKDDAMNTLNALLETRWVKDTFVPLVAQTSEEALTKVLQEREKELIFRGGIRWSDLRRLNLDSRFAQTIEREIGDEHDALPPGDKRYTFLIPVSVIQESGIVQNER